MRVADEIDLVNTGHRPFFNFKDKVDAILVALDDFRINRRSITPIALINFQNTNTTL